MRRAAGLALAALGAAAPAGAQVRTTLDAGVSQVSYEGFLPSAAFAVTPTIQITGARLGFAARGTWLTFESGNNSIQGVVAGSLVLPATPRASAEVGAELGGSKYEGFAQFGHALGHTRFQLRGAGGETGWIAATLGGVASDSDQFVAQRLAAGVELLGRDLAVAFSGTGTYTGPLRYVDFATTIRHAGPSGIEAEAVFTARATDQGGDGLYLEASLSLPLNRHTAVVLAGGRYAADAVRGNIAGTYATAAFRISAPGRRPRSIVLANSAGPPASEATVATALVEVRRGGDACTLVFRASGAEQVELMADFTDWVATGLQRGKPGFWSITLLVPPGRHRLNLRVNGGMWGVPAGTTPEADDFQGTVGAVVVP